MQSIYIFKSKVILYIFHFPFVQESLRETTLWLCQVQQHHENTGNLYRIDDEETDDDSTEDDADEPMEEDEDESVVCGDKEMLAQYVAKKLAKIRKQVISLCCFTLKRISCFMSKESVYFCITTQRKCFFYLFDL